MTRKEKRAEANKMKIFRWRSAQFVRPMLSFGVIIRMLYTHEDVVQWDYPRTTKIILIPAWLRITLILEVK